MSSLYRVAVAGAGNMGIPIILTLLESGRYAVTVLSRSTDAKTRYADKLPTSNPNLSFAAVDYKSVDSLTPALKDHFAVVSTLSNTSLGEQNPLLEASIAAGVTRFFPSEFGSDTTHPAAATLPVFKNKVALAELLDNLVKKHPSFSYTILTNGPFFDWGLGAAFILDPKNRSGKIYDGGDVPFSTTTLATIAKAIVGVLDNLDATKNRVVRIHDAVVTQNQLVEIGKKLDKENKPWNLSQGDTKANYNESMKKLQGGKPEDFMSAMVGFIHTCIFGGEKYGSDFSKTGTDNELLGIPFFNERQIEEVVARYL